MKKLLDSINNISETNIQPEFIKNVLDKVDFSDIYYENYLSGYDLNKYNKIIIKEKPVKVFLVTWPPQKSLPVHNHKNYWVYLIVLKGLITESLYEYDKKKKELSIHPSRNCKEREVIYEPINVIHRLSNPSPIDTAISLHVSHPPIYNYDGTLLFDIKKKKIAELNAKAPNVSWEHPKRYYNNFEEDAYTVSKMW